MFVPCCFACVCNIILVSLRDNNAVLNAYVVQVRSIRDFGIEDVLSSTAEPVFSRSITGVFSLESSKVGLGSSGYPWLVKHGSIVHEVDISEGEPPEHLSSCGSSSSRRLISIPELVRSAPFALLITHSNKVKSSSITELTDCGPMIMDHHHFKSYIDGLEGEEPSQEPSRMPPAEPSQSSPYRSGNGSANLGSMRLTRSASKSGGYASGSGHVSGSGFVTGGQLDKAKPVHRVQTVLNAIQTGTY